MPRAAATTTSSDQSTADRIALTVQQRAKSMRPAASMEPWSMLIQFMLTHSTMAARMPIAIPALPCCRGRES